jgi:hypothetical protein
VFGKVSDSESKWGSGEGRAAHPHMSSWPSSVTAAVCAVPQATCRTRTLCSASTSLGVPLCWRSPWPSSPQWDAPQVYTPPEELSSAPWKGPKLMAAAGMPSALPNRVGISALLCHASAPLPTAKGAALSRFGAPSPVTGVAA